LKIFNKISKSKVKVGKLLMKQFHKAARAAKQQASLKRNFVKQQEKQERL